jgi:prefoldin subunit 1
VRGPSSQLAQQALIKHDARFVFSPPVEVKKRLAAETTALEKEMTNLDKKLHYLDTTYKNSQQGIEQLLRSGGG